MNVLNCARRWGKDVFQGRRVSGYAVEQAAPCAWFAPSYRMLADNYRYLSNALAPIVTRHLNNERLDLLSGGFIDFWSLEDPDRARGRRYRYVCINEAAMVSDLMDAWNFVIRPTLLDLRGDADLCSTPRGLNDFYTFWELAGEDSGWSRFHATTYDNPHIDPGEIDAMRQALPERVFKQEILAEFLADGSYFQNIDAACTIEAQDEPETHAGHAIYGGLDWAMSQDWTVLTLGCRDCGRVVAWDRFQQIDYTYQRARVLDLCARWSIAGLLPETNSIGTPNIELLRDAVPVLSGPDGRQGFTTTATSKPALIQRLASGLEHDGLQAPREYAPELRAYQVEMGANNPRFSAPSGQHDDRVMSLALCWWAMTNSGGWWMT